MYNSYMYLLKIAGYGIMIIVLGIFSLVVYLVAFILWFRDNEAEI